VNRCPSLAQALKALRDAGVELPPQAAEHLERYLDLLEKWNQIYNLTAIRDRARMITHHVVDALAVLPHLPARAKLRLLDVGSGAGLPGIPLAVARPEWQVTLLDSNHKKTTFMRQVIAELGLRNAAVETRRVEDFVPPERFDVVISRAFSDLRTFAHAALPLLASGGVLAAMKGVFPHEEIEDLPEDVRVVATPALSVPGVDGLRHLVLMEPT
jgi:16S rRNA (guanine527-N7)-methyltransferase